MDGDPDDAPQTFRTRMPARYSIGLLLLGALVTIMVPLALVSEGLNGAVPVAVLLGALFFGIALMRVTVRVGASEVSIILAGIIRTAIPYHRIDTVSASASTGVTAGMGLRILPNGTTGYLVGGPSVRLTTGRTAVLVSSRCPEELAQAIERRRGPRPPSARSCGDEKNSQEKDSPSICRDLSPGTGEQYEASDHRPMLLLVPRRTAVGPS